MRSVRSKILAVVLLCLVPMFVATRIFYWLSVNDMRADAEMQLKSAEAAFSLELQDDLATLRVAAKLIGSDPDLLRELAVRDRELLFEHIDDFSAVYPDVRIFLTDADGTILAASHERVAHGSLKGVPEMALALHGAAFAGVTALQIPDTPLQARVPYAYVLTEPIRLPGAAQIGALLATFPLDRAYLDNTEQKEGLALALRVGTETVAANGDHPDPAAQAAPGEVTLRDLPDGRTFAFTAFEPHNVGSVPAPISVVAAKDLTGQFTSARRLLWYRMLAIATIALLALTAGFWVANPMVSAIGKIAAALPGVAQKSYQTVEGVHSGDELQALAESFNAMVVQLREAGKLREALGKYLSRAARDAIEHGRLELGGTTLPATVLFSDIRGFTSMSEKMEPEEVLSLLNRYFTEMVGAVIHTHGIVDKFIGDCIMAVWGPPEAQPDDALNAVRAALEMRRRLEKLNVELVAAGGVPIRTGIGIHTGQVVAGNMGADTSADLEGKMEYTVIGDTVNLASRLESLTKDLHADILLSEDTYRLVSDAVDVEALQRIRVRGREQEIQVYRLIGLRQERVAAGAA